MVLVCVMGAPRALRALDSHNDKFGSGAFLMLSVVFLLQLPLQPSRSRHSVSVESAAARASWKKKAKEEVIRTRPISSSKHWQHFAASDQDSTLLHSHGATTPPHEAPVLGEEEQVIIFQDQQERVESGGCRIASTFVFANQQEQAQQQTGQRRAKENTNTASTTTTSTSKKSANSGSTHDVWDSGQR